MMLALWLSLLDGLNKWSVLINWCAAFVSVLCPCFLMFRFPVLRGIVRWNNMSLGFGLETNAAHARWNERDGRPNVLQT